VELTWEYRAAGGQWLPLAALDDGTAAFSRSGAVTLSVPVQAARERDLVWIRVRIVRGYYDIEPRLRQIGLNVLPCAQRETVSEERLGRGNGRPDQVFQLANGPLLISESGPAALVEVNGQTWESVSSLDDASPASQQYVLDVASGRAIFGNGLNGQIPQPGADVRAKRYQVSSGRSGNVAKGLNWRFRTLVVPGVALTNAEPAAGGTDPESLNDLELRARAQLSRPQRAITLGDIEGLALGTPGVYVARAHAIPNCPTPERITVVAVPKVRPGRTGPPQPPSDTFLRTVRRHLQQRRLICDDLRVTGPIYIEVEVAATLRLSKGAGAAGVIERARLALDGFLSGEDDLLPRVESSPGVDVTPCPTRWPFGRWVFPSEVYAALDRVNGVDAITNLALTARRNGAAVGADDTGAIPVPRIGLVYAGAHRLTVATPTGRQR
jgi:predicted phage baseplate assembly protein